MNKTIQIECTPEEKKKIIQIDNLDYKIKQLDKEYAKEKHRKEPDIVKLRQYEEDYKFYISKRNELVREVYG